MGPATLVLIGIVLMAVGLFAADGNLALIVIGLLAVLGPGVLQARRTWRQGRRAA